MYLLPEVLLLMKIAQFGKSTYNNYLQQSIQFCNMKNISNIFQYNFAKVKGHTNFTPFHCKPISPTNIPTKYQLPTSLQGIDETRF